jgi:hypothetical protein
MEAAKWYDTEYFRRKHIRGTQAGIRAMALRAYTRRDGSRPAGGYSEDKNYVEMIAEMLNKGGAEAVHFMDIVENMIN